MPLGSVGVKGAIDNLVQVVLFIRVAPTGFSKTVSGIIYDASSNPTSRTVRLHRRSDGALLGEAISDASTGAYSIPCPNEEVQRIALDDAAGTLYNDLLDRVLPG
jgi:hypothetical protein